MAGLLEAVSLYRELATLRPDVFLPDLAGSLNNLGCMQSDLGRREDALASSAEAVSLYLQLFQRWPQAIAQNFAISLGRSMKCLADMGRDFEQDPLALSATEALRRAES